MILVLTQQELAQGKCCSPSLIFKIGSYGRRPSRQIAEWLTKHTELEGRLTSGPIESARVQAQNESLEDVVEQALRL